MASGRFLTTLASTIAATAILGFAGCGGGGGASTPPANNPPPAQGTISGIAVKGPVSGGMITAYAVTNGAMGSQIGSATTDAQGNFSIAIGTYAGPVMLQLSGGSYTDEATGTTMSMMSGDVLTAVMPSITSGATVSNVVVTPLTSMAQTIAAHMTGGLTDSNISTANTDVGEYFMVSDILHTMPMDPLVSGAGSTSQDAINYGMSLAAMSQFAKTVGMTASSAFVTAMMNDAADGALDGKLFGNTVMMGGMAMSVSMPSTAGTTGLGDAMLAFLSSAENKSGVTVATMQSLLNQLKGSNGQMVGSGAVGSSGNTIMSGTAFYGPMTGGTIAAYAITGGTKGAQITSTAIGAQGTFAMSIGNYTGPVMLRLAGGTYTDEATGKTMRMGSSDLMAAMVPTAASGSTSSGIWITPLSSMAENLAQGMSGGLTDDNINSANSRVGSYFMVSDILHAMPIDPLVSGSSNGATQDQEDSGLTIAAMSEYAKGLGMTVSSAFVTAMMSDASDSLMDGKTGNSQISMGGGMMMGSNMMQPTAGTSGLATAMSTFLGSSMNRSGLNATSMNALIQKLAASNGQL